MLMMILQPQTKIQTEVVVDTCLMFNSIIQQLPSRRAIKIPNNPKVTGLIKESSVEKQTEHTEWEEGSRAHPMFQYCY